MRLAAMPIAVWCFIPAFAASLIEKENPSFVREPHNSSIDMRIRVNNETARWLSVAFVYTSFSHNSFSQKRIDICNKRLNETAKAIINGEKKFHGILMFSIKFWRSSYFSTPLNSILYVLKYFPIHFQNKFWSTFPCVDMKKLTLLCLRQFDRKQRIWTKYFFIRNDMRRCIFHFCSVKSSLQAFECKIILRKFSISWNEWKKAQYFNIIIEIIIFYKISKNSHPSRRCRHFCCERFVKLETHRFPFDLLSSKKTQLRSR